MLYLRPGHQRRAVITGLGVVSPSGVGKDRFWADVSEGVTRISRIERFDTAGLRTKLAGEIKDFDPGALIPPELKVRRMARHTQFAVCCAIEAVQDSGLVLAGERRPIMVIAGAGSSAVENIQKSVLNVANRGANRGDASLVASAPPQAIAGTICEWLEQAGATSGTRGSTLSTACAAGLDAIGAAAQAIQAKDCNVVIAGGTDAFLSMTPLAEFTLAGLSNTELDPETASRPFDRTRQSGVLSEGGAFVVVESLEHALARRATIYAEIRGYHHCMDPNRAEPGSGLALTMERSLTQAKMKPRDLDYVSAWGPGHPAIDRLEVAAIKRALGSEAYDIPTPSIKGVVGNPIAAAGAMQAVAMCLAFRDGVLPPTANLCHPDPECDLDHVARKKRVGWLSRGIVNAHGIAGGNSSLILSVK